MLFGFVSSCDPPKVCPQCQRDCDTNPEIVMDAEIHVMDGELHVIKQVYRGVNCKLADLG